MNLRPAFLTCTMLFSFSFAQAQSLVWARTFNMVKSPTSWALSSAGHSIVVDKEGSVYSTGVFRGHLDFDPGPDSFVLECGLYSDVFVSKLDAQGKFLWAKRFGTGSEDKGTGIALDDEGNVYVTGYHSGDLDADPGSGTFILPSMGNWDIFLSKFDSDGNFIWSKQLGGNGFDRAYGIFVRNEYVYLTGCFSKTADFDPDTSTALLTTGNNYNPFVCKLDTAGNYVWARGFLGNPYSQGNAISVDVNGNVYTTGTFTDDIDFDPGPKLNRPGNGKPDDAYVSKLNASGNFVWIRTFGGTTYSIPMDIATDSNGNVYTSGIFNGKIDFNPGTDSLFLNSYPSICVFLQKLRADGSFGWAIKFANPSIMQDYRVKTDAENHVYLCGTFKSKTDFDPGPDTAFLSTNGDGAAAYVKLNNAGQFICAGIVGDKNAGNVRSFGFTVDAAKNVYITGSFSDLVDFDASYDTFMMWWSQQNSHQVTKMSCKSKTALSKFACRKYVWNTSEFTESGVYKDTFTNVSGCDSMVRLTLNIHKGNDSTITTIACDSFYFRKTMLYSDAVFVDTVKGISICDSLTYRRFIIEKIQPSISNSQGVLTAYPAGYRYQWIDCSNGLNPLPGDTDQVFYPKKVGNYMVHVSGIKCADFSDCIPVTVLNKKMYRTDHADVRVYPNPAYDKLYVELKNTAKLQTHLTLSGADGRQIHSVTHLFSENDQPTIQLDIAGLIPGIYFVTITRDDNKMIRFFVKE